MEDAGVTVRWFRPLRRFRPGQVNHRTHRKVMIVDEAVGFTGGVGIADEWLGNAARRERVARHALPYPRAPRSTGCAPRSSTTGPRPTPSSSTSDVDRFPEQPKPGDAVVQCVRGASETG